MSIQSYIRRLANQTCHNVTETFTPTFGTPVDQAFGDAASEGDSEDFARADHRHGMPNQDSFVDDLETKAAYFSDLVLTTTTNDYKFAGTTTLGLRDDPGPTGGFGTVDSATAAALNSVAGVWIQNVNGGTTLSQVHPFKRTRNFTARVRPVLTTATQLPSLFFACGMIRTTTNADVRTITDGVYFSLATDASGVGNYKINAMNNGSATSVDTGVATRNDGSNVYFDILRFTYDGTTVAFYINGEQVGTISDSNIPPAARKLAGFGAWITNGTAVARTLVSDFFLWTGLREYTE